MQWLRMDFDVSRTGRAHPHVMLILMVMLSHARALRDATRKQRVQRIGQSNNSEDGNRTMPAGHREAAEAAQTGVVCCRDAKAVAQSASQPLLTRPQRTGRGR